ncbi:MAG: protein kinase domain-containing protein [Planctomycetota bacterium]|jgi:serine/threonine protein kinase
MVQPGPEPFRLPSPPELAQIAVNYQRHRLQAGETVGVFRIQGVLGRQGNVSTVYLAEATVEAADRGIQRGRRYIIKGIPYRPATSTATNARNLRSFFNEIRVLPFVTDPGANFIVRLVDANGYPSRGKVYMAFEELAYQSVREKYADKRLDPDIVLGFARCLTRALSHLHRLGIVHGDVKPDNFMIDVRAQATLVDFGSAFFTGRKAGGKRRSMHPPDPDDFREPFTPLYCSPELARYKLYGGAFNPKDEATDAWALGVTLWELLMGERPFYWMKNESLTKILEEIGRGTPPVKLDSLQELAETAPRQSVANTVRFLQHLIGRLLAVDMNRRLSCFEAQSEVLSFSSPESPRREKRNVPETVRDRLEMARRIAMLDEDDDDRESRKRSRGRDTAALELRTLEMREAYLKAGKSRSTAGKGWFTPPGEEAPAPPPKKGRLEPDESTTGKGQSFEEFAKLRKRKAKGDAVSFEEFARQKKEEEIRRMKEACEEGSATQVAGDTRAGSDTRAVGASDTALSPLPPPPPPLPRGGMDTVDADMPPERDDAAETFVDPTIDPDAPWKKRKKKPVDPRETQDE